MKNNVEELNPPFLNNIIETTTNSYEKLIENHSSNSSDKLKKFKQEIEGLKQAVHKNSFGLSRPLGI